MIRLSLQGLYIQLGTVSHTLSHANRSHTNLLSNGVGVDGSSVACDLESGSGSGLTRYYISRGLVSYST